MERFFALENTFSLKFKELSITFVNFEIDTKHQTFLFQTEIAQLINTFYSNKVIFL